MKILDALQSANKENRLHHAYLLTGSEESAKVDCVEKFAAQIFSEGAGSSLFGGGADAESVLQRIKRGNHPDFMKFQPVNNIIGVDEVRELPRALSYAPLEAGKRIVMIKEADALNPQASNAILKILEEPPHHTMFFLLASSAESILETVVSRCQMMHFVPLTEVEFGEAVKEFSPDLTSKNLSLLFAWSGGSIERAKKFLSLEAAFDVVNESVNQLLLLWENSPRIPGESAKWLEEVEETYSEVIVDAWHLLLRDFMILGAQKDASCLFFPELRMRLQTLAAKTGPDFLDELTNKTSAINRFRVHDAFHGGVRLNLTALFCELQLFSVGKRQN